MRFTYLLFYILIFFEITGQNIPLNDTLKLDKVFVSGTKTETLISTPPLNSIIINNKEIENFGSLRLTDILEEQLGLLSVPDYTVGGLEGIQVQGLSSDYIQILVDGVPSVGRLSGNIDLDRFALNNIKQIEVIKGPSSSLYGSAALGGVVNLITEKKFKEQTSLKLSQTFGTNSIFDSNVYLSKKIKKSNISFSFNNYSNKGYDLDLETVEKTVDPKNSSTISALVEHDFNNKISFFQSFKFFNQRQSSQNIYSEIDEFSSHTKFTQLLKNKWKLNYELYYTEFRNDDRLNIDDSIYGFYDHSLIKPEIRISNIKRKNTVFGIAIENESLKRSLFEKNVKAELFNAFLQYDLTIGDDILMILGTRLDNHSSYNSKLSSKISFKYYHNDKISSTLSMGQGFKSPDFRQLYLNFTNSSVGYSVFGKFEELDGINKLKNLNEILNVIVDESSLGGKLIPESSVGINFGINMSFEKLNSRLNYFRNDISNLIDTRVIARKTNGQNVFGYVNIDEILTQGLEIQNSYKLSNDLLVNLNYQLLYAFNKENLSKIREGNIYARNPDNLQSISLKVSDVYGLPNRSRHNFNFKLSYLEKYFFRLIHRSKYGIFDTNGNNIIDRFDSSIVPQSTIINFSYKYNIFKKLEMQLTVKNAANFRNVDLVPNIYGREFYARLNYSL